MSICLRDLVTEFVNNNKKDRYNKLNVSTVSNLINSDKPYSFIMQDGVKDEVERMDTDLDEIIISAIKNSIKGYDRGKNVPIEIYKKFVKFINDKCGINISKDFLEDLPLTSIERQLKIIKMLHGSDIKISELPDLLLVSDKTIEGDINKLRGDDEDPLSVMGQKLIVEFERSRNRLAFSSTVHPLFLTFNLTQVITSLEGLKKMSEMDGYKQYAINAARTIWAQLSDYAKGRIFGVSEGLGIDINWYKDLGNKNKVLFYTERMCSSVDGIESALMCFKNGLPCFIEYINDNGEKVFYRNCLIMDFVDKQIIVDIQGEKLTLNADNIVKAALTINELY